MDQAVAADAVPLRWYQRPAAVAGMVAAGLIVGLGVGLAIPTGGATVAATPTPSPTESSAEALVLSKVVADCGGYGDVEVVDDGESIIIDGAGDDDLSGVTVEVTGCVLAALDVPRSTVARMQGTRALDGTQTGEWGEYSATWTYHPDDGLDIVIERS